jgi:hypothetical protein
MLKLKNVNLQYRTGLFALVIILSFALVFSVQAAREDCGKLPNDPAKPVKEVAKEADGVQNDYDEIVEEDERPGVVYLAVINGKEPKPNACGLNPSNDAGEWTGWGGPLNGDNVTIGEGAGSRNEIVIGGTYFPRGVGTHSVARLVYSLTGDDYRKFEAYIGMSDEKDPAECAVGGTSEFIFKVDGKQVFKSEVLPGTDGGKNVDAVFVEIEISAGAKELEIEITDGGDGACGDHAALGDAKLLTPKALSVEPINKLSTTWGQIKTSY